MPFFFLYADIVIVDGSSLYIWGTETSQLLLHLFNKYVLVMPLYVVNKDVKIAKR